MNLPKIHDDILSLVTFVGGSLSIIGCLASIIIYKIFGYANVSICSHELQIDHTCIIMVLRCMLL